MALGALAGPVVLRQPGVCHRGRPAPALMGVT
jgi:hypothetical protein